MIKVIWLSLPDLNGESRRKTLEALGYAPFDLVDMLFDKQKYIDWNTYMLTDKDYDYDWENFFNNSDALTLMYSDMPLDRFIKIYPDCKIIIESISYEEYAPRLELYRSFMKFVKRLSPIIMQADRTYTASMKALSILFKNDFSSFNIQKQIGISEQEIMRLVPEEQQLILRGNEYEWKDLCDFLGKPIPNVPISKSGNNNSYASIVKEILINKFVKSWLWYVLYILIIIGLIIYLIQRS
jgi:hypothetical protein